MIDKTSRAIDIAEAIKAGKVSAVEVTQNALASIADLDQRYNCFTEVTPERALKEAAAIDRARQQGAHLPPLAG
ncbi:MAG TPA: Asp-tRNA(Asn)/Glu-tRNA(Gln) amidotransferase GatCAB subunit A, partial [Methylophilaceae bacterium]|nr:Asp-tRNA(Asn)/Glu-tRNA(Gln) amidotransferase GatCAB subunit A [Methylophilaceae bacterium]